MTRLSLVVLAFAAYALGATYCNWLCDDAFISFRYARHLAEGAGLVFNPARATPVEGYSNLLWVLGLGICERFGLAAPLASRLASAACGVLLLAAVVRHVRRRHGADSPAAGAAALFLATLPAYSVWATSGLATLPTALLLFLTHDALTHPGEPRAGRAAGWAAATALVRADGAVWVGLLLAGVWLATLGRSEGAARRRASLVALAVVVVTVGMHVAWRLATYGDFLPLTARVKAGLSAARIARGTDYLVAWLLAMPAVPVALALVASSVRAIGREILLPGLVVLLGGCAYAVWVGGDFMPFGRFLFPTLPFQAVLLAEAVEGLRRRRPAWTRGACALCVGTSIAVTAGLDPVPERIRKSFDFRYDRGWQSEMERLAEMDLNVRRWVLLGRALALHAREDDALILGGIGAVGYHSEVFLYDTYGLVTPEVVAHGRVLERSSPGHDLRVNPPFFLDHEPALDPPPTLLGAYLTPADGIAPDEPLPWWTDVRPPDWESHRWRARITEIERHALDTEAGFPDNAVLVLLRTR